MSNRIRKKRSYRFWQSHKSGYKVGKPYSQPKGRSGNNYTTSHKSSSLHVGSQEWRSWLVIGCFILGGLFLVVWLLPQVLVLGLQGAFDALWKGIGNFFGGIQEGIGNFFSGLSPHPPVENAPPVYDWGRTLEGFGTWLTNSAKWWQNAIMHFFHIGGA